MNRRFQVHDIDPVIIARKILSLADKTNTDSTQTIEMDLCDFYKFYSLDALEKELSNATFSVFCSLTEQVSTALSMITGGTLSPAADSVNGIKYYNEFIQSNLDFLKSGRGYADDTTSLQQYIIDYLVVRDSGLRRFKVTFRVVDLISAIKKFHKDYLKLQMELSNFGKAYTPGNAPSIEKQGELFLKQVRVMKDHLRIDRLNVGMDDWGMRMSVFTFNGKPLMLHPYNMDYNEKSLLPIILELNGMLDIYEISLKNKHYNPAEANIQYTISTPCAINIFRADSGFIPPTIMQTLSESQIVILGKIYEQLQDAMIFFDKPKLKQSYIELSIWLIKKVVFCLEEKTYLRDKAVKYLQENANAKYLQVEDDFFLPFIYERFAESFPKRVVKKPEKSNGEIDLLFDNIIPIELKVWKTKKKIRLMTIQECMQSISDKLRHMQI